MSLPLQLTLSELALLGLGACAYIALALWFCRRPARPAADVTEAAACDVAAQQADSPQPAPLPPAGAPAGPANATEIALRAEIAELRALVAALDTRMKALQQRQETQMQVLLEQGLEPGDAAGFAVDDLIALARQGWPAAKLARVARMSLAEAEFLQRLHGEDGARH